jgi:hypothetical protein
LLAGRAKSSTLPIRTLPLLPIGTFEFRDFTEFQIAGELTAAILRIFRRDIPATHS